MKNNEQIPVPSSVVQPPPSQQMAQTQQVIPPQLPPSQQSIPTLQTAPTQLTAPSQTMFTTKMDDFNSEDEIGHPSRKRRKDSDESYEESQFSMRNKKPKQSNTIKMQISNSQPIAQNLSKLKERRSK